jgi:hypothetical protein
MKHQLIVIKAFKICFIVFLCTALVCCKKDKQEENDIPAVDEVFDHNYVGFLSINFTNQIPEFSVEETMEVEINTFGLVNINSGTLDYYGETLVSDDSKIERSGQWTMDPTGILMTEGGVNYVKVDAHITINYDNQKVYAKNNQGQWQLVAEIPFSGTPNSDLNFNMDDAIFNNEGAVVQAQSELGSIIWHLILAVEK